MFAPTQLTAEVIVDDVDCWRRSGICPPCFLRTASIKKWSTACSSASISCWSRTSSCLRKLSLVSGSPDMLLQHSNKIKRLYFINLEEYSPQYTESNFNLKVRKIETLKEGATTATHADKWYATVTCILQQSVLLNLLSLLFLFFVTTTCITHYLHSPHLPEYKSRFKIMAQNLCCSNLLKDVQRGS